MEKVLLVGSPGNITASIYISTVDVYGYPLSNHPMHETDPFNPTNCEYAPK